MPSLAVLLLVYSAFIALGLPDSLIGVAWPSMRAYFNVPLDALGLLPLTGTIGYFIASFFSGRLTQKMKVPGLLSASCALTGLVLLFYTISPSWWYIVATGFLSGLGAGAIDAGLNLYTAQNLSRRHMQWLHACWGIGTTAGPLIMTAGLGVFNSWKPGYVAVGTLQIALAVCFAFAIKGWKEKSKSNGSADKREKQSALASLSNPAVLLSMLFFFLYSGVELALGMWGYTILTESRGISTVIAGVLAGSYWGLFTAGRILAGFYTKHVKTHLLVFTSLSLGLAGAIMLWLNISQALSLAGFVLTGFAIAPVFPSMVSATKDRVGLKHEANAIGMQMSAAALGSALLPGLEGILARRFSPEAIVVFLMILFVLMIILYMTFIAEKSSPRCK
jgi:fucose permease